MKLVGLTTPEITTPSIARAEGDTLHVLTTVDEFWTAPEEWLSKNASASVAAGSATLRPPVPPAARVICVGLNYKAHAAEGSHSLPEYPTLFGRWTPSLSVGDVPAPVPTGEQGLDWEAEVAAYVARPLRDASPEEARTAVLGFSTFNDLTARRAQKLTAQWTLGKNGDHSGPMGPIVTADEVGDLRDGLRVRTRVNGVTVQDGNTKDMIFDVADILALISKTFTLHPGDVIATGTPEGVGYVRNPPWLLTDGDVVEVEVDKLGVLRTPIVGTSAK
ncbi:fumarylacetoacetate hydrolase family protein [Streptomyces sp. NPDC048385]|uniref:fumarylacetoacetate hydrolase family protein n=1 Tax=unclassified Streptomyces TaxID=2593676 RepID=UPI0034184EFC